MNFNEATCPAPAVTTAFGFFGIIEGPPELFWLVRHAGGNLTDPKEVKASRLMAQARTAYIVAIANL